MEPRGPLVEVAVETGDRRDLPRLLAALARRCADRSSLHVAHDPESGQTVLGESGEDRLDAEVSRLRRVDGLDLRVGAPQVAYRETLTRRVEREHAREGRGGGPGGYARVRIVFAPEPSAAGVRFASAVDDDVVPERYRRSIARGIASTAGVLAGFPVVDVAATLVDGAHHDRDSSEAAFEAAARAAFREALQTGGAVLLEPIMAVEVRVAAGRAEGVASDLRSRRGQIRGRKVRGGVEVVEAAVPLAAMFGYANQLRAMTRGDGAFAMRLDRYAPVPPRGDGGRPPPAAAAALRA